ncbi:putative oxidoreductase [Mycobacterium xenopi 4042]|uniref:Putative oxidoreductase n=1 Tax=Mycobacterium xenopi 4042 TaxID=1299334 RepID=X7ZVB3_MYCXE|nr:putative oxidoreductase [Mycobacterium xenopi 4042]
MRLGDPRRRRQGRRQPRQPRRPMEPRPHVPVIDKYGIRAVTAHTGNPLAHSFSLARYAGVLLGMSGMPVTFSPGTVDQWPKNLSSHLMYGRWWGFPVPDIERTDLLVIMGANPAESQGSLLAAPMSWRSSSASGGAARWWSSTRSVPAPQRRPTNGCQSLPAPMRLSCSRSRTRCSTRTWFPWARWPRTSRCRDDAAGGRRLATGTGAGRGFRAD